MWDVVPGRLAACQMVSPGAHGPPDHRAGKVVPLSSQAPRYRLGSGADRPRFQKCERDLIPENVSKPTFTGFIAAWPTPQIEASVMTAVSSSNSVSSHFGLFHQLDRLFSTNPARRTLAATLILEKAKRFSATSRMESLSDRTTTAAEPMKQPCCSSIPKSSGMSAIEAGRMPPTRRRKVRLEDDGRRPCRRNNRR